MLFKLLFAEIANYIPADALNKIVLYANDQQQAEADINRIKAKKKISNQKYREKKRAQNKKEEDKPEGAEKTDTENED